jgi:two-component system chemotaxis response regulator CheB
MPGHDIITIGSSAGGVEALKHIVAGLPADVPAAMFVVQHIRATEPSLLAEILSHAGPLPAVHPRDGEPIQSGHIYIAPPDHHMLPWHGHIHVVRGPKENGFRPAIDATFRTAARSYGPRVVGVVLTGMLDDGTAGLLAIKRRGGIAVVQEPAEAAFPSMPTNALRYVSVDAVLSIAEMPSMLTHFAHEPAFAEGEMAMTDDVNLESAISDMDFQAMQHSNTLGTPSSITCPDCGGVLVEYYDGDLLRFRCQVGHAFSPESLNAQQTDDLDAQLWAAYRALDERASLARRLAQNAHRSNDQIGERRFMQRCELAEQKKRQLLQLLAEEKDKRPDVQQLPEE